MDLIKQAHQEVVIKQQDCSGVSTIESLNARTSRSSSSISKQSVEVLLEESASKLSFNSSVQTRMNYHKSIMSFGTYFHACVSVACLLIFTPRHTFSSKPASLCSVLDLSPAVVILAYNVILMIFFWKLRQRAEQDAADVLVYNFQVNLISVLLFLPFTILSTFITSTSMCSSSIVGIEIVLSFTTVAILELLCLKIYIKWHQKQIAKQEGYEV